MGARTVGIDRGGLAVAAAFLVLVGACAIPVEPAGVAPDPGGPSVASPSSPTTPATRPLLVSRAQRPRASEPAARPAYPPACAGSLADGAAVPLDDWAPVVQTSRGLLRVATAQDGAFLVHTAGGDRSFLNGVNLGATLPGSTPGEWAAGARTYTAWLRQIGSIGFRSIRTYTLHPASFYAALADYNRRHPQAPIYLIQGVAMPEEALTGTTNLFSSKVTVPFDTAIENAVAALRGDHVPDDVRMGRYEVDVTPWLAGMIIGVEWDPGLIAASDATNRDRPQTAGTYVDSLPGSTPTEVWLARRLETAAAALAGAGVAAPLSFVNRPATDPLHHPTATTAELDLVGIDANHLVARPTWPAGLFATYHAYPYLADFLTSESGIAGSEGDSHPFGGYLASLRNHHLDVPVILGEVGVPGGWVPAGPGPSVYNYGGYLESAQMAKNAELLETAREVGLGGAMMFEWVDEWFKPTWNMTDLEFAPAGTWHNLAAPDQHFGIMAVEPIPAAQLDGSAQEWDAGHVVAEGPGLSMTAAHDAGGLYVMVQGALPDQFEIRFDSDPRLVHRSDPQDQLGDLAVRFTPEEARVLERTAYEVARTPTDEGELDTVRPGEPGEWMPFEFLTRNPTERVPADTFELGPLRRSLGDGTGTVPAPEAGWGRTANVVEVRIPWVVLSQGDPSQGLALQWSDGRSVSSRTSLEITALIGDSTLSGSYDWEPWSMPLYRQRLKAGSGRLAAAVCRTAYS